MTHYTIAYPSDRAIADTQALEDVFAYLSPAHAEYINATFYRFDGQTIGYQSAKQWIQALSFACMMSGIRGYPVRAMKRKFLAQFVAKGL
jgi:hypothetical protein